MGVKFIMRDTSHPSYTLRFSKVEIKTEANSLIYLETIDRTMVKGKQKHKIRWGLETGCPNGYIVQRITRDTKTTIGTGLADEHGIPTGKVNWGKETIVRADYYEMWEVWQGRVFPGKSGASGTDFESHAGLKSKGWFGDSHIEPSGKLVGLTPADIFHDIFSDTVPACGAGKHIKGKNKILGEVYFFPSADKVQWMKDYLVKGERNKVWGGTFTGGVLLQLDGAAVKAPNKKYLKITRYEAIEFSNSNGKTGEISDRGYPGIMRKKGQGVINATGVNKRYTAGTCLGPT
jgi:hypothetical protein